MNLNSSGQCRYQWLQQLPDEMLAPEVVLNVQQQVRGALAIAQLGMSLCQKVAPLPTPPLSAAPLSAAPLSARLTNASLDIQVIQN